MNYKKSIVTFLDILGFQEIVRSKSAFEIHELLSALRSHTKPDELNADEFEMKFVTFSDCTVRSVPLRSQSNRESPCGLLFFELLNLVYAQVDLLRDGYFMRGALTIGDIYVDDQTIFGPAMVDAYRLESEFAIYPRVVIDPVVFQQVETEPLLISDIHDLETEKEYYRKLVKRDADGLYFIDYLRASLTEFDEEGMEISFFRHHKNLIIQAASAQDKLSKVAAKYLWLANYHNNFIGGLRSKGFKAKGLNKGDFFIKSDDLPLVYRL